MLLEPIISTQNLFYILLVVVFIVYWVFAFSIVYHLTRFGVGTLPKKLATAYLLGTAVLFCWCFLVFAAIDFNILGSKIALLFSNIYK